MFVSSPNTPDEIRWREEQKAKLRRAREDRIRSLKREIQVARSRMREHDHLLAELRSLEKERVDEMREIARRKRRPATSPTPIR
jgi:hypothetical protein